MNDFTPKQIQPYRQPVSNIAYHVYPPEQVERRSQSAAARAFERTLSSYAEHEQLADSFQVQLDRQAAMVKERRKLDKGLKARRQRRTHLREGPLPGTLQHPHQFHQHHLDLTLARPPLRDPFGPIPGNVFGKDQDSITKRQRRPSDAQGGFGDNALRIPKTDSSVHSPLYPRHGHSTSDRSCSNSPDLPLTPSPRLDALVDLTRSPLLAPTTSTTTTLTPTASDSRSPSSSTASLPSALGHGLAHSRLLGERRKRKQVIPIHPSIVERIPGITLRIQPERQGDQLQVEILKNVEDYPGCGPMSSQAKLWTAPDTLETEATVSGASTSASSSSSPSPDSLQAKQDLARVKETIESGRPAYAFYPHQEPGATATLATITTTTTTTPVKDDTMDVDAATTSTTVALNDRTNVDSGHLDSHAYNGSSNATLTNSLITHHPGTILPMRPLPLSWDTFATRECVVNKVIGKHTKELDLLEEVVQDVIARQQYSNQDHHHHQHHHHHHPTESRLDRGDGDVYRSSSLPAAATASRRASAVSTDSVPGNGVTKSALARRSRTGLARTTRSRTHGSGKDHGAAERRAAVERMAHDDIDLILRRKRIKKREERRRQSSKASSKDRDDDEDEIETLDDEEEQEDEEDEEDDRVTSRKRRGIQRRRSKDARSEDGDMESLQHESEDEGEDRDENEDEDEEEEEDADGDQPMVVKRRVGRPRRVQSVESDTTSTTSRQDRKSSTSVRRKSVTDTVATQAKPVATRKLFDRKARVRRSFAEDSSSESSESSEEEDNEGDRDYKQRLYKPSLSQQQQKSKAETGSGPSKRTFSESRLSISGSPSVAEKDNGLKDAKARRKQDRQNSIPPPPLFSDHKGMMKQESDLSGRSRSVSRMADDVSMGGDDMAVSRLTEVDVDATGLDMDTNMESVASSSMDISRLVKLDPQQQQQPVADPTATLTSRQPSVPPAPSSVAPAVAHKGPGRPRKASLIPPPPPLSGKVSNSLPPTPTLPSHPMATAGASSTFGSGAPESGGRTRARARSFSSHVIKPSDKTNFFETAMEVMEQKRRETLAKKRAAKAEAAASASASTSTNVSGGSSTADLGADDQQVSSTTATGGGMKHLTADEVAAAVAKILENEPTQAPPPKIESTNLPKSSKSLPGRVLRRNHHHHHHSDGVRGGDGSDSDTNATATAAAAAAAVLSVSSGTGGSSLPFSSATSPVSATGTSDPATVAKLQTKLRMLDRACTSCRLDLSVTDKVGWTVATESGEIRLPKTWGTHAILCNACRGQYLSHHWRCTACFYVPVKEEMVEGKRASGVLCSRCRAGTWLKEAVVGAAAVGVGNEASGGGGGGGSRRRKTTSDMST